MTKSITAATLTLNPALDRTMYFDTNFREGKLNRARESVTTLGSKGINVSRAFKILGVDATAYSFSGGDSGVTMKKMLDREGIGYDFTETAAPTRINIKMIDSDEVCTEANEAGGPVTEAELENLLCKLEKAAENTQIFALGGSIPPPVEKSVYKTITELLKNRGARVILDCDGEALRRGIEARPELIKPNLFELSGLLGFTPQGIEEVAKECRRLYVETGVNILCTLSENGAVYAGCQGVWSVTSPQVTLRGFTGAGDTFLTAFTYMKETTGDIPRAMIFASSAAAAKVELHGSQMPTRADMEKFCANLTVRKIYG